MATTGTAKAKELPRSATIKIRERAPHPSGEVEVAPDIGRIHFRNEDKHSYRLRFIKRGEVSADIDILLPTRGTVTVLIRKHDEFHYTVIPLRGDTFNGQGGGPIRN
ncbi:MAG TPA: hypothetical protein VE263_01805 [Candidatus Angelobacter sp.]|nr:hypothetical protein [Candidatus Angelobacter sp.]